MKVRIEKDRKGITIRFRSRREAKDEADFITALLDMHKDEQDFIKRVSMRHTGIG